MKNDSKIVFIAQGQVISQGYEEKNSRSGKAAIGWPEKKIKTDEENSLVRDNDYGDATIALIPAKIKGERHTLTSDDLDSPFGSVSYGRE